MYNLKSNQSLATRTMTVVKANVEQRGEAWLLGLGYAACNDYAQIVVNTISQECGFEHVRFETIARYIRQYKASLKAKNEANKQTTTV